MKKTVKSIKIYEYSFPAKRSFQWKVFIALVILYFLGNLAGVPLLRKTNMPIEPIGFWAIATFVSAIVIALSLLMANRTSLGAPLIEGRITKAEFSQWVRTGFSLIVFLILVVTPGTLFANRNVNPTEYPFGWELLLASLKAGIVEEIFNRLFFVSLFVWLGGLLKRNRDDEGRPKRRTYWVSILIAALLFGWAHVDARLGHPTATFWDYFLIMSLNSFLGFCFGWFYWILGLEWAMMAHFSYDVFVSIVLIPVLMLKSSLALAILSIVIMLGCVLSWRMLISASQN